MIKVSVVVPVYNGEKSIKTCLDSILRQTYDDIEVVVVDDGSTDDTIKICKEFQKKDDRFFVISKENGGVSSARNVGIKESSGDFIFFLDADDYVDETLIEKMVASIPDETTLFGARVEAVYDSGKKCLLKRKKVYTEPGFFRGILNGDIQGFSWGFLFKAENCRKVMFDEDLTYCEDLVFLAKYLKRFKIRRVCFMDERFGLVHYTQHANSVTNSKKTIMKNLDSQRRALESFDVATGYAYHRLAMDKKVVLCEAELQKAKRIREYWDVLSRNSLPIYGGDSGRYKIFSTMYQHKMILMMFLYYRVRALAKVARGRFR